jgi:hypothetical protein
VDFELTNDELVFDDKSQCLISFLSKRRCRRQQEEVDVTSALACKRLGGNYPEVDGVELGKLDNACIVRNA